MWIEKKMTEGVSEPKKIMPEGVGVRRKSIVLKINPM